MDVIIYVNSIDGVCFFRPGGLEEWAHRWWIYMVCLRLVINVFLWRVKSSGSLRIMYEKY